MAKILLDYVFPISVVASIPAASTAFLKQVIVVAKPKSGQEGNVGELYECTTEAQVAARTDNTNASQLFDAGMAKVYILLSDDLDIADYMADHLNVAWTVLISSDFVDADVTPTAASGTITVSAFANLTETAGDELGVAGVEFVAQTGTVAVGAATFQASVDNDTTAASLAAQINGHASTSASVSATVAANVVTVTAKATGKAGNALGLTYTNNGASVGAAVSAATLLGGDGLFVGPFDGVVGYSTHDEDFAGVFAAEENQCGFYDKEANASKNMFYAFGKLLSNAATWNNQQFISMPEDDDVEVLGDATSLFDDKVSFVITDSEFGNRLALFAVGGKAIVAPYIGKNLRVDMQSRALSWIGANQPAYTLTNAALLEQRLQEDVINQLYVNTGLITAGQVGVSLLEDNFVANGEINIAEPGALWRIVGEMRSTL